MRGKVEMHMVKHNVVGGYRKRGKRERETERERERERKRENLATCTTV